MSEEGGNNEERGQAGDLGQRGWGREGDNGNKGRVWPLFFFPSKYVKGQQSTEDIESWSPDVNSGLTAVLIREI